MLRSKDITGIPVFTIAEGKEIGKITDILINPSRGIVVALAIEDTTRVVTYSSIKNIGKDAVMIDSASQLLEISEHKNIERWKDIKIIDTKAITSSGRYVGQVADFLLDPVTGKILSCVLNDVEGERLVVPSSRIVTFGKDALIIVDEEIEEAIEAGEMKEATKTGETLYLAKEEKKAERAEIKTILEQLADEIDRQPQKPLGQEEAPAAQEEPGETPIETTPETISKTIEGKPPIEPGTQEPEPEEKIPTEEQLREPAASKPEEKPTREQTEGSPEPVTGETKGPEEQVQAILDKHQHDFLLGKKIKRDLLADDGALILRAGETITEEVLQKAKEANKYLELGFYI